MLEAAGCSLPSELDSRSLLPLCNGGSDAAWPDALICEHNGHAESILQRIIIHDRSKYVAALFDGDELYDLVADPYEMNNLVDAPEFGEVKLDLRDRLIRHIKETEDRRAFRLAYSLEQGY